MHKSLYIASSLLNRDRVVQLRDKFIESGIGLTYDWTTHGRVEDPSLLIDIARKEAVGVIEAKCILLVMPARSGSHFEAGIAWALKKPIVMLIENPDDHIWVSFHKMPEITRVYTEDTAIHWVKHFMIYGLTMHNHLIDIT